MTTCRCFGAVYATSWNIQHFHTLPTHPQPPLPNAHHSPSPIEPPPCPHQLRITLWSKLGNPRFSMPDRYRPGTTISLTLGQIVPTFSMTLTCEEALTPPPSTLTSAMKSSPSLSITMRRAVFRLPSAEKQLRRAHQELSIYLGRARGARGHQMGCSLT